MISVFNASQIKEIDHCTIKSQGIESVDLMERAALSVYEVLVSKLDSSRPVFIFAGTGNNGGDALAIARMLLVNNLHLQVFLVNPNGNLSLDCKINKERLRHLTSVYEIKEESHIPRIPANSIVIDGLFGSGLNRPIEGVQKKVVTTINNSNSMVYSIDMPSGLFVDDNGANDIEAIIRADEVFTFQFPKLSLLLPDSNTYCKKLTILDIGLCKKCIEELHSDYKFVEKEDFKSILLKRGVFSHKGDFGKVMLIAGAYGKMGAAVLAAKSCLRSGAGLLTMHIPRCGVDIMQVSVPEAMVDADVSFEYVTDINQNLEKYTIGIGPGIGTDKETKKLLSDIFEKHRQPMILDADALNLIAGDEDLKKMLPSKSILTPHPVEFERLIGRECVNGYDRLQAAKDFASQYDVYVVLKGAYSAIITPEKTVFFNSSGNPGMATGGSGDVLTGMLTSLLAQKYTSLNAALLGVYLHGYAGDLSARAKSEQSMLPSDMIDYIGRAYKMIK